MKKFIRYCVRCVMPETKPDLLIDEKGVCNACRSFENRKSVDWAERKSGLIKILEKYKSKTQSQWDCIVPVSGGKDSTYQVIRMLELGMKPLCVNARVWEFSDIGRRNIENIKEMGVDLIEFSPNPVVRRKIARVGLTQVGDISWPEHVGIFTIPVKVAVHFRIPLLIWGENSQDEYGGPASASQNNYLDRRWLEEFGGMLGLRVSDLVGLEGIAQKDLAPYIYPEDNELKEVGVTGLFLGYYMPWDGLTNTLIAQAHGFETYPNNVEGSMLNYENLDSYYMGVHDYFKFLKFGFARTTDHVCLHIRRGRITREDGLTIIKRHDGKYPHSYLGKPLEELVNDIGVSVDQFNEICDRFTNKKLFVCDAKGHLVKDSKGNLTKINYDNIDHGH